MLTLPIQQRSQAPEVLAAGGRQLFLEAVGNPLSPVQGLDDEDGESSGVKVTVKNTFIELHGEDEEHADSSLHATGAHTCSARLSSPTPSSLIPESRLKDVVEEENSAIIEEEDAEAHGEVSHQASAVAADSATATEVAAAGVAAPPAVPPPQYMAPAAFEEGPTSPPPSTAPGALAGRDILRVAFASLASSPIKDSSEDEDDGIKVRVKNTFIDVERDASPVNDRSARSCTARLSGSSSPTFFVQKVATAPAPKVVSAVRVPSICVTAAPQPALPTVVKAAPQTLVPTVVQQPAQQQRQIITSVNFTAPAVSAGVPAPAVVAASGTSPGSALHGQVDADGQPLCEPCAWFYKATGCQNGATCRRCHLCPEGEIKIRRKKKIAKLRGSDAPPGATAAAAGLSPGPGSTSSFSASPSSFASPGGRGASASSASHFTPSSSRWADFNVEEEEDAAQAPSSQQASPAKQAASPVRPRGLVPPAAGAGRTHGAVRPEHGHTVRGTR